MSYNSKVTFRTLCDRYFAIGNARLYEMGLLFSLSFTGAWSHGSQGTNTHPPFLQIVALDWNSFSASLSIRSSYQWFFFTLESTSSVMRRARAVHFHWKHIQQEASKDMCLRYHEENYHEVDTSQESRLNFRSKSVEHEPHALASIQRTT
jgi:hypothetical protein